jgi:hypothetical protein
VRSSPPRLTPRSIRSAGMRPTPWIEDVFLAVPTLARDSQYKMGVRTL